MKKVMPMLLAIASAPVLAAPQCEYQFSTNNGKSYGEQQLAEFIEHEMRGTLSRVKNRFNVKLTRQCAGDSAPASFTLGMATESLYIKEINGHQLADDVVMYTDAPLTISRGQFETAFEDALTLSKQPKKTQQSTLKMFAFVLAESARFSDVENAVTTVFSSPCSYQWNDYSNLLRHWKTMSIFANTRGIAKGPQYVGGTRAFLIAPITTSMRLEFNTAVSDGWEVTRYKYNKRQHDKPVSIGDKACSSDKVVAQN